MTIRHPAAALLVGAATVLASCGGGGGGDDSASTPTPITSFELVDPTARAGDQFGRSVAILANGNIVVTDPFDFTVATNSGAVHLYNPRTRALIGSIFGDAANDLLGSGGITALANGNFVIVSPNDDVGGVADAGSVKLFDGTTGAPIGSTIADDGADRLGSGGVTALANGNFVIVSPNDDVGGVVNAGSVQLINGTTGAPIGSTIAGDAVNDLLGGGGVIALASNNFVIVSHTDDVGGVADAGSVQLINGTTGAPIGSTIAGSFAGDISLATVTGSATGDFYVLGLSRADNNGLVDSGLVRLIAQ